MQQEKKSLKQSFEKMSIEDEIPRNSSNFSKKSDKISIAAQSYDLESNMTGAKNSSGIFKKLLKQDSNKANQMCEETQQRKETIDMNQNRLGLFISNENDKNLMKEKILKENFQMESEGLIQKPLNHECQCIKYRTSDYCPINCCCYDYPEICSKTKCCSQCYRTKVKRLPEILQVKHSHFNISNKKMDEDFDAIWGSGKGKKHNSKITLQKPKSFRCECRKTQCDKNYCNCRKNNEQCDEKCDCILPCVNRKVAVYPIQRKSPIKVYLDQSMGSLSSSSKSMKFDEPEFNNYGGTK